MRDMTLAGLLISYFVINPSDMMPGVIALLPVLSTALIIMCADHESSVAKILSHKYLVLIGLMSYSLYLWHQPVLALYKDIIEPHPTALSIAIILVLIFILSYLSWKFVEQPFRNKSRVRQKQIFVLSVIGLIFTATLGAVSILNNGFIHRFPVYKAVKQTLAWPDELNKCDDCSRKYGNNQYCLIYDSTNEPTDILIGDSHANHFFLGLSAELGKTDRNLLMIGAGGCPPLIDIDMGYNLDHGGKLQCMKRTNALYKRLLSCKTADRIFLAFSENTLFDLTLDFTDSRGEIDFSIDRENAVRLALMRTVELAANNGKTVYIIEDLPDTTFPDFEKSLLRSNDYTSSLRALKMKSNNQQYQALLSYLQEHGIRVLRTHHLLYRFPFTDREQLLYRDGTHLSREGSRFVGEGMALQLRTNKMMTGR
ncbi:acyltransferase family protein [Pelodictyon luteolum]|nr:acyltransferase family protein [Pelodictyon luteolum]